VCVRQQVVRQRDRLCALQVRVTGEQRVGVLTRAAVKRQPRPVDGGGQLDGGRPRVKLEVGRHLVVAAARRVQPPPRLADDLGQPPFDVHVNVFERRVERPLATLELARDLIEAGHDGVGVGRRDETDRRQHARVGLATAHVVAQQAAIEGDRRVQRRCRRIHCCMEARAAPAGLFHRAVTLADVAQIRQPRYDC
jgi:hypothetical protein